MAGHSKYLAIFSLVCVCCICFPDESMALQTHGKPEGIYVHQMAHIFFMAALGYLYWDTKRSAFSGRGWFYLRVFCVLTILWNLLALVGHAATQNLIPGDISVDEGYLQSKVNAPLTFVKVVYYTAKLDHLLTVPGMFFLFLSLRSFYNRSLKEDEQ